jgi:hypothetical protein
VNDVLNSDTAGGTIVMSRDIGIARTCDVQVRAIAFPRWAGWSSGGLVVAARVDDQVAEELAGGSVDDADVQVVDEQDDVGSVRA